MVEGVFSDCYKMIGVAVMHNQSYDEDYDTLIPPRDDRMFWTH